MFVSTWANKTDLFRPYKGIIPGTETSVTIVSTTDIIYATDNLYNFFRVGSTIAYWYTLTTSGTFIISSLIPADDPNLSSIQSIGLSQNKAVVYHSNGQVDYYKHVSSNLIKKLFSRTITQVPTTAYSQYHISLGCMCNAIKNTYCFSQTLVCTILNKAAGDCKGSGDSYTTW